MSLAAPSRFPLVDRLLRGRCEGCGRRLSAGDEVAICARGCAFCPSCTEELGGHCLNCPGELVRRPHRTEARGRA